MFIRKYHLICNICNKFYASQNSLCNHNKKFHNELLKSSTKVRQNSTKIRLNSTKFDQIDPNRTELPKLTHHAPRATCRCADKDLWGSIRKAYKTAALPIELRQPACA